MAARRPSSRPLSVWVIRSAGKPWAAADGPTNPRARSSPTPEPSGQPRYARRRWPRRRRGRRRRRSPPRRRRRPTTRSPGQPSGARTRRTGPGAGQPRLALVAHDGVRDHEPVDGALGEQRPVHRHRRVEVAGLGEQQDVMVSPLGGLGDGVDEPVEQGVRRSRGVRHSSTRGDGRAACGASGRDGSGGSPGWRSRPATRASVSRPTLCGALRTFDTVCSDTPAARATLPSVAFGSCRAPRTSLRTLKLRSLEPQVVGGGGLERRPGRVSAPTAPRAGYDTMAAGGDGARTTCRSSTAS